MMSPPTRARLTVQIITMGAIEARQLLDSRARNDAVHRPVPEVVTELVKKAGEKGRGRGWGPYIDPRLIEDCVRATGHATSGDQVVVVDARGFSDPDQDRKHIGLQAVKIRDLVRHTEFRGTLEAMASNMRTAAQNVTRGGRLVLVVYCRKGVHRSVSFGHVAWELLHASPHDVDLLPIYHASAAHLWPMNYCGECRQCRATSSVRDEAITRAIRVWRPMSPVQVM